MKHTCRTKPISCVVTRDLQLLGDYEETTEECGCKTVRFLSDLGDHHREEMELEFLVCDQYKIKKYFEMLRENNKEIYLLGKANEELRQKLLGLGMDIREIIDRLNEE